MAELFGFNPFVPEYLVALGLEFLIKRRVAEKVIPAGVSMVLRHNGAGLAGQTKPSIPARDDNLKKQAESSI